VTVTVSRPASVALERAAIRRWLADAGFTEQAFVAPDDVLFSVGVHRFTGMPQPLASSGRIFQFGV
jgi:hypothetical protein